MGGLGTIEAGLSAAAFAPADPGGSGGRPASAIYEGVVTHRRGEPVTHAFTYRVFMALFDLDELPELLDPIPWWTARADQRAAATFRPSDHLDSGGRPLAEVARDLVAAELGHRPEGPVRLLTNPRYLGFGFNPVSFFYLYGSDGETVEAMIAEVTNTPWGERRSYVLGAGSDGLRGRFEKALHVSPFMGMDQDYRWRAQAPGERLSVTLSNYEGGERIFEAGVALDRREITPARMKRLLAAYPPMTFATVARIYWQALKLAIKRVPFVDHPNKKD
ncbi:MAG: DUF1365 domain-containing protein [Solirubrobacterales bacterium]